MSFAADIILLGEPFLQKPNQLFEPRLLVLESAEVAGGGGEGSQIYGYMAHGFMVSTLIWDSCVGLGCLWMVWARVLTYSI